MNSHQKQAALNSYIPATYSLRTTKVLTLSNESPPLSEVCTYCNRHNGHPRAYCPWLELG